MHSQPLISIITPCYNGAKYLANYFKGILIQKHRNIELIFVDDGSTDNTKNVALYYGEKLKKEGMSFKYIYQNNSGQAAAINKGLPIFKGEYLTWLDSDDIMLPDNLSKKLSYLEKHPECGLVLNEYLVVKENDLDNVICIGRRKKPVGKDNFFEDLIYCRNVVFGPGTILVRRSCIYESIPSLHIYESTEGQNWQMMLPLTFRYQCGYIEERLLKCVSHMDSHSRKQREFVEEWTRENNFITLCSKTVQAIPQMSREEKEKYCKKIRIYHNQKKLEMSIKHRKYKHYFIAKKELKKDPHMISLNECFWYIQFRIVISRIINRILESLKKQL